MMVKKDYCLEEIAKNSEVLLVGSILSLERVNEN
jgi:hypothetical protein